MVGWAGRQHAGLARLAAAAPAGQSKKTLSMRSSLKIASGWPRALMTWTWPPSARTRLYSATNAAMPESVDQLEAGQVDHNAGASFLDQLVDDCAELGRCVDVERPRNTKVGNIIMVGTGEVDGHGIISLTNGRPVAPEREWHRDGGGNSSPAASGDEKIEVSHFVRLSAQRFALPACGRAWTMLGSRKNPKPEKCS